MFDPDLKQRAADLVALCWAKGLRLATAESCTGGLVAGLLTEIAGSSAVVERGFVTYSNEAKEELLGVPHGVLVRFGAVSEETARAMAEGAVERSHADVAVAITGIAGPGGGTAEKPVGLVHFAATRKGGRTIHVRMAYGDIGRGPVRRASLIEALRLLQQASN